MFRRWNLAFALSAGLAVLAPAASASCAMNEQDSRSATSVFADAKRHTVELQTAADMLLASARYPDQYSFETTATLLSQVRDIRDEIAEDVCALQAMRSTVDETDRARIDEMARNLRAVSQATGRAITHFNERTTMADLYQPGYQQSVDALYASAKALRNGSVTGLNQAAD